MRLWRGVLIFALSLGFLACSDSERERPPDYLIQEDSLVALLTDMALAESAASANVKNVPNSAFDSVYAFHPLLDHGIRKSQYDSTLAYYSAHIAEYKALYEKVLETLSRMQAQNQSAPQATVSK